MRTNKMISSIASALLLTAGLYWINLGSAVAGPSEESKRLTQSESRARMKEQQEEKVDASGILRKSTDLYSAMVKGVHGRVPESILAKAQCVAVLPEVITGALVVGGSHGVGIASCRENNKWSAPAFVKLNALSIGAQIGGKSSDIVLFALDDKAKIAIKRGSFSIGADAGVVAGTFDQNFDATTHGAVAYTRTEGAFAGLSMSGGNIISDDISTAAFYGKDVNYISLLEGRTTTRQDEQVDRFTSLLPR